MNEDYEPDPDLEPIDDPDDSSFTQDGPDLFGDMLGAVEDVPVDPDFVTSDPVDAEYVDPEELAPGLEPQIAPCELDLGVDDAVPSARVNGDAAPFDDQPLALYRRYRPDDFRDLIGQEQVTGPLMRAIANGKVNHAYLFSGPRGCGKTTSARILARCLNCAEGPTPHPCGHCQSCRDLATGGPGSIDVIEIDAASHGLVEDARDLRERAYFAPVASRYKVYIIDEAHMVTTHGFNALLKVVEEPPPHVKFIFATTEPEKVIGTIRSRTHHYPFRLVPPRTMTAYLEQICAEEGVEVEHGVLPLVVRAGGGSVRDSLSVLDQLLGAAGQRGVSYAQATALLGFTPDALLDEMVDAFAAGDGRGVFATIDKVIEVGQDPRRFGEDLLQRMRDLVIVAQVPDAISSGLIDAAGDQAERLTTQAAALGAGELTRAAEVIATGLTQMRGTTAPRLHLELICARVLLPGADVDERGTHARLDRLERRLDFAGAGDASSGPRQWADADVSQPGSAAAGVRAAVRAAADDTAHAATSQQPSEPTDEHISQSTSAQAANAQRADSQPSSAQRRQRPAAAQPRPEFADDHAAAIVAGDAAAAPSGAMGLDVAAVRRLWPQILDEVKSRKRFTHALLNQNAQVAAVNQGRLILVFPSQGVLDRFNDGGSEDVLADSIIEVLGVELKIVAQLAGAPLPTVETDPRPAERQPRAASDPYEAHPNEPRQNDSHSDEPQRSAETRSASSAQAPIQQTPAADFQALPPEPPDDEPDDWAERANPTPDHPAEPHSAQVTTASDALTGAQPRQRPTGQRRRRPASAEPKTAKAIAARHITMPAEPIAEAQSEPEDELGTQGASLDDDLIDDPSVDASELLTRELDAELIEE